LFILGKTQADHFFAEILDLIGFFYLSGEGRRGIHDGLSKEVSLDLRRSNLNILALKLKKIFQ
jgi:hypothetical protein